MHRIPFRRSAFSALALATWLAITAPPAGANHQISWGWRQVPTGVLEERSDAGIAFDQARGEVVAFGGTFSTAPYQRADTWLWRDGWRQAETPVGPSARSMVSMAYHPGSERVVMFGGFDRFGPDGGVLADTWSWDGDGWQKLGPASSPPARYGGAMALDSTSGRLILFGGYGADGVLGDTWTWTGSTWVLELIAGPPPRSFAAMASTPNGWVLMFGGQGPGFSALGDTWVWSGSSWLNRFGGPDPRQGAAATYDSERELTVLVGGYTGQLATAGDYMDDTWTWNGSLWSRTTAFQPSPRNETGAAFDSVRGEMVMFGGWTGQEELAETWVWNGNAWSERDPPVSPPTRSLTQMAFDGGNEEVVMFGGSGSAIRLSDTWTWDGEFWILQFPFEQPPPRYGGVMGYDEARQETVMFGGSVLGGFANDTWVWDGLNWQERQPAKSPPPLFRASVTYDAERERIVLFGGYNAGGETTNETWLWDGTTWTRASPDVSPPPRADAGLAADPSTGAVVLFGGVGGQFGDETLDDTWTWDGGSWSQLPLDDVPAAVQAPAVVTDPIRGEIVMFGGANLADGFLDQTWTLQATNAGH